jgi:hypothetical protein
MNHAGVVRKCDGLRNSLENSKDGGFPGQRGRVIRERPAADELHDVEPTAVREFSGVVDRDDARMFEARQGRCGQLSSSVAESRRSDERDLTISRRSDAGTAPIRLYR